MGEFHYELYFLSKLVLTITIETTVLYLLIRFWYQKYDIPTYEILFTGFISSFATLPYVWFVFPILTKLISYSFYIWSAEISVTLIETLIIYKILKVSYKEAFTLSFIANLVSFGVGYFRLL